MEGRRFWYVDGNVLAWRDAADCSWAQNIFQMHRDIVYDYPSGVEQLGSSDVCEVQGMYKPKELITVQGHPEFTEEIVRELLVKRHELGILDDETYAGAESRVGNKHDGVLVAQAFLRMLME